MKYYAINMRIWRDNGTDAAEREQRLLADFAEPQGRKACVAGLKRRAEYWI